MMFILSTIAAIAAVVAAEGLKSPLEGYTAVPMTWHGVNTTDGSDVILSGTVEEIHAQLPGLDEVTFDLDLPSPPSLEPRTTDGELALTSRKMDHILCWVGGWGNVDNEPLQAGIDYLRRIAGPCLADPGPRVCTRISCSWKAAIWFCNDTPADKRHGCAALADYAEDIRTKCHLQYANSYQVRGQLFDTESFNVVVGADDC